MNKKNKHQQMRHIQSTPSQPTVRNSESSTVRTSAHATVPSAAQPKTTPSQPGPRNSTTSRPTLEQQRAAHALNAVRELAAAPFAKEYSSYVESLPATIVMNGLGQACATLLAAANGSGDRGHAYSALHGHLQSWVCRPASPGNAEGVYPGADSLIDAIVQNGQSKYVHAQAEALAYLVWLKKFSQAFLRKD